MSYNIILDSLPETVKVDGKEYFVDTDFRTFIIFEKMLSENLSAQELVEKVLSLFFVEEHPDDIKTAIDEILYLYRCGNEAKKAPAKKKNGDVELKSELIYDYEFDAPYIYGAFLSQYRIDLNDIDYLHWWKFQALFKSLAEEQKIVKIMSYRATNLSKIEDRKERDRIAKLKNIYALPQNLTVEDKIAMAGSAFGGGFS